jgi:hypothetical protein
MGATLSHPEREAEGTVRSASSAGSRRHPGASVPMLRLRYERSFPMADDEVLANQRMILENQKTILANQQKLDQVLANQKTIEDNQAAIQRNQQKLDRLLANQETIQANQAKILANQEKILAK